MNKQRQINYQLGHDTFIRNATEDAFRTSSTRTFQTLLGEVKFAQPEPLWKQTLVTVDLARNGTISNVPYPNAFCDPLTGNLHGMYEGPIPGQEVLIGFENGNKGSPFVIQRFPYQGKGNSLTEPAYTLPMTKSLHDATDVVIGHFSGSELSFNTGILSGKLPGSVSLHSMTGFTSECELGTSFTMDVLFEMKNSAGSIGALLKEFATIMSTATTFGSATSHAFSPDVVANITAWIAKLLLVIRE